MACLCLRQIVLLSQRQLFSQNSLSLVKTVGLNWKSMNVVIFDENISRLKQVRKKLRNTRGYRQRGATSRKGRSSILIFLNEDIKRYF